MREDDSEDASLNLCWFLQGNISMDVNIHETSVRSGRVQKTSKRGGTLGRWLPAARIVEELLSQTMLTASYFERNVDLPAPCLLQRWLVREENWLMLLEIWVLKKQCSRGNFLWDHEKHAPQNILVSICAHTIYLLAELEEIFFIKIWQVLISPTFHSNPSFLGLYTVKEHS